MWKSDWYGVGSLSYPMEHVLASLRTFPPEALIGIDPDEMLEADRESFELAALQREVDVKFVGLDEPGRYRRSDLAGIVLHHPPDGVKQYLRLDDLVALGVVAQLPPVEPPAFPEPVFLLIGRVESEGQLVWLYLRQPGGAAAAPVN